MFISKKQLSAVILMLTLPATSVWGSPSLVMTGCGGSYVLQAMNFKSVGGMDITIGYDKSTLANPEATKGGLISSSIMIPNLTEQGIVRVGIINATGISGSGALLFLNFKVGGEKPGQFTSLSVDAYGVNINRNAISIKTAISVADICPTPTPSSAPVSITATSSTPYSGVGLGTVSLEPQKTSDTNPVEKPRQEATSPPVADGGAETKPPVTDTQTGPTTTPKAELNKRQNVSYESILSLFKNYQGPRTLAAMTKLFTGNTYSGIRQAPSPALADGKTTATMTLDATAFEMVAPNFSLKKAKLLSLKTDSSRYILEILPDAGGMDATVTVLDRGGYILIPLIAVPPLDPKLLPGKKLDETSVNLFLGRKGPVIDLNGDGRQDYLDDYMAVANYLVTTVGK